MALDTQNDTHTLLANTASTFPDLKGSIWNLIGADIRGNQLRGELVFETQVLTASDANLEGYFGWVWNGTKPFQVDFDAELQADGTLYFTSTALAAPVAGIIAAQYDGKFSLDYQSLTGTWFGNNIIPGTWSASLIEEPDTGLAVTADNIMVAALNLSARAYSDAHHGDHSVSSAINEHIKNWSPLEATDLGFSVTDSRFSKVGGAVGGDLLRYDFKNASATVGLTILDGKKTLGITFEGTNPTSATDIAQDLINIKNYYTSLKGIGITNDSITSKNDFIQSVVRYINDQSIEQVLVTGHSLGGATAQSFMSEYGQQDTRFIGVTFGSPGTTLFQPVPEDRFVNIQHDGDAVVIAGTYDPLYSINGSVIKVVAEYPANEFPNEHKIYTVKDDPLASYSKTIDYITSQLNANLLFKDLTIGINNSENMTSGLPGNEMFVGLGGDDTIEGGLGVDTAIYTAPISSYVMNKLDQEFFLADQRTEPNNDGTDTLKSIERIIFTDFALALDLDGSAGMVAKLIGAVFGAGSISNAHYVAIGLSELDKGTSYEDLAALAIDAAGAKSPEQVTSLLWSNVVGSPPTPDQILPYIDMLHKETTVGTLGVFAAEHEINQANINLTGLVANGIAFDPSYYQPIG